MKISAAGRRRAAGNVGRNGNDERAKEKQMQIVAAEFL